MKLVYGVGMNDADYHVYTILNGKQNLCPFYVRWVSMLNRCYSEKYLNKRPTYIGCSVDPVWHSFMNFKLWMEKQDWEGKQLDKDLLFKGNKVYSPDTCVFVTSVCNTFINGAGASRGKYPIGVNFHKASGRYISQINENINKCRQQTYLGLFDTPEEAHQAWYKRKRELAIELAAQQTDPRVSAALLARFP